MIALLTLAVLGANPACASLPINGAGQVAGRNGAIAIVGTEGRQGVRVGSGRALPFGPDVVSATLRAACPAGGSDYVLVAATMRIPSCPVQYRVVEITHGRIGRASPGFGSCADGATAEMTPAGFVVTMPAGPASPTNVTYRYAAGRIVATVPAVPPVIAHAVPAFPVSATAAAAPSDACGFVAHGGAAPRSSDVLLASFSRTWPADWRSRGRLHDVAVTPEAMRRAVTDLACLATLPGGDRLVADIARPLFESKRHGAVAFDQLDEVARGAAVDPGIRAAARSFHAQMRFEVDTPRLR